MSVPRILALVMKMQTVPIVTVPLYTIPAMISRWHNKLKWNYTETYELIISLVVSSDVDECSAGSGPCDENADCTNSDGSYSCICKQGFTGNGTLCQGNKEKSHFESRHITASWGGLGL